MLTAWHMSFIAYRLAYVVCCLQLGICINLFTAKCMSFVLYSLAYVLIFLQLGICHLFFTAWHKCGLWFTFAVFCFQGIHERKNKKLLGFSFDINIENFEAFLWNLNLSANHVFWRSDFTNSAYFYSITGVMNH